VRIKDAHGGHVTALSMGPPNAAESLRECLYRGADRAVLLTDRRSAASDTQATSYALSCAVRTLGIPDLILCGRQAIDGDTAQVGPQLAEKLGMAQLTYVEEFMAIADGSVTVRRALEDGFEVVCGPLPALLTVTAEANEPRAPSAKRVMKYKRARAACELDDPDDDRLEMLRERNLLIEKWGLDEINADESACGGSGSPTRVKKIDSVQLRSEEHKPVESTTEGLTELVEALMGEHILD